MILDCPKCQAFVEAEEAGSFEYLRVGNTPSGRYALLRCGKCESPLLVQQDNIGNMAEGDMYDTPNRLYPPSELRVNPRAPEPIRVALQEAIRCFRVRSYTAAAIMCRKTLEGVCVAHGVKDRNLMKSLQTMQQKDLIDTRLFEWSDALRLAGNEAAHGVETTISQEDAGDILEFTNAIIDYLFSYRDQFQKFVERRGKKEKKTTAS